MKPDPRIKLSVKRSEQNNMQDGVQEKQQKGQPHTGSRMRGRGTLFGRLPRPCRGIQNMLPAYLDESLNAGERQIIAQHLDVCATCRYELRLLARSEQALIGAASAVLMPGDLRAGFYARLAMTPRPADNRRVFVPALAVCGLLLIASTTARRLHIMSGGLVDQNTPVVFELRSVARTRAVGLPNLLLRPQIARVVGIPGSSAMNRPLRSAFEPAHQGDKQISMLVTKKTPSVGGAKHQSIASVLIGRRTGFTFGKPWRHKERKSQWIAAVPRSAFSPRVLTVAMSKRNSDSNSRRPHNMQIALLTRDERHVVAPQTRYDVRLTHAEHSPLADSFGLQTEALTSNAVQLPKDQHSGLAFQYDNSRQMSLSTMQAKAAERESMTDARVDGARVDNADEMDGVSFQVKDAQRGFVSGTRSESRMQMRSGRQVLSVHLEDQDRPEPDPADKPVPARPAAQPVQTTKTGSEKER